MEKWMVMAKRADFKALGKAFSIDPVIARIIRNREVVGMEAMEEYLKGDRSWLHDPGTMKDLRKGAEILVKKISENKHIRIIGDYDIDGIMSSYILWEALTRLGAQVDVAIPDRIVDGYGLNQRLIEKASQDGVDTILTCDNGIAAREVIAQGRELGLTIIVTDHHEVPYEDTPEGRQYLLPPAHAVVNPKQIDCQYPFKELCGAGVAYKLVQGLFQILNRPDQEICDFLPYAAFATVGDVMELQGENRVLVKEGLALLQHTDNLGLSALIRHNKLEPESIRAYHIGFVLGPCLNASGRLDTAERACRLLQTKDQKEAWTLAQDLTELNISRKELTNYGVEEARELAQEAVGAGDKVLVLFLPDCHESLAGIIAGRIRELHHRPVFVLTRGEEGVKGSGRSIPEYSMYEEMSKVKELFTKYGGHPLAAGLSMEEANIPLLRQRLNELNTLTEEDFAPKIMIDMAMPIDYITRELVDQLSLLEPFGKGNEKPLFADHLDVLSARILGKNGTVCKLQVSSEYGTTMEAIYFGTVDKLRSCMEAKYGTQAVSQVFGETSDSQNGCRRQLRMSFTYYPEVNSYRGKETLQLVIKNYR